MFLSHRNRSEHQKHQHFTSLFFEEVSKEIQMTFSDYKYFFGGDLCYSSLFLSFLIFLSLVINKSHNIIK